jgi:enoyl-CoA hydratase
MAKAKYYLLTADFVDGPEAERIGLVTKCVADEEVRDEALAIADRLAAGSATAVQWTKRVMNGWLRQALPIFGESVALEMLGFLGPDAREGVAALRQRRAPVFPSAPAAPTPS